jgi:hypothetical protein
MSPTVIYKGYTIQGRAIPLAESGDWVAEAMIRLPGAAGGRATQLTDPDDRTFTTREDAEGYAVQLAIRWVDRIT